MSISFSIAKYHIKVVNPIENHADLLHLDHVQVSIYLRKELRLDLNRIWPFFSKRDAPKIHLSENAALTVEPKVPTKSAMENKLMSDFGQVSWNLTNN